MIFAKRFNFSVSRIKTLSLQLAAGFTSCHPSPLIKKGQICPAFSVVGDN
jgi:hypothetical protein